MKVLLNCGKVNGRDALIIKDGNMVKYITCRDYDPTLPEGQQWCNGEYTHNIVSFAKLILAEKETISHDLLTEIATKAMSYLADNDLLEDFMEDRDVELSYRERDFFFPE